MPHALADTLKLTTDSLSAAVRLTEDQQGTLAGLLDLSITRMNHLEGLLLTFASVGLAGWAFLFATPFRLSSAQRVDPEFGKLIFAVLFSAAVACAFNVLYMGRMANNIRVLEIERLLAVPIHPFHSYPNYAGGQARVSFYLTASFIPLLAAAATAYAVYCVDVRSMWKAGVGARVKVGLLLVTVVACAIALVWSSVLSWGSIEAFMGWPGEG
jgi:hypothetical protein